MSITALEMNLLRRQNLGDGLRRSALAAPNKPAIIYYTTMVRAAASPTPSSTAWPTPWRTT